MTDEAPLACGLYRTTSDLDDHPGVVAVGSLAFFHNHSNEGAPILLLPHSNENNRWRFHEKGYLLKSESYRAALEPIRPEGFYRLNEHFHPDDKRVVPAQALVQLGYTAQAEPILFFPTYRTGDNALIFPTRGMKIPASIYALLEPLDVRGPHEPKVIH